MFFFFNDTATTEIYTLSLHDALPISLLRMQGFFNEVALDFVTATGERLPVLANAVERRDAEGRVLFIRLDRKSTRLNSSHANISYAVFCLKKKTNSVLRNIQIVLSIK